MLDGLLAPLRLLERAMEALESLPGAARELALVRSELTRVREQTEPLGELLPALEKIESGLGARLDAVHEVVEALESEESFLNGSVRALGGEVKALHETLAGRNALAPSAG